MPYRVASLADLPANLKQAALHSVGSTDKPISICVFPGRTGLKSRSGWEYIDEQALLFMEDGIFQIQAPASAHPEARIIYLRAADLLYARLSLILMYGRLDLVDERLARVVVEFNAAGFDIIRAGLQNLLSATCGRNAVSIPDALLTTTLLDEIGELSYKFKNGLYLYGLLPGEQVEGFVFQPGLWEQRWHFFRLKISETTLLALTDKQLVVVEEQSRSRFPTYGWIFTFFPRKAIKKIGVSPTRRWQELIIEMNSRTGSIDRRILLEQSNVSAWQDLWSRDRLPTPAAS